MKKLVLMTALFAGMTTLVAQVPTLQSGLKYLENENYEAALTTFNAIAKADPKNGTIYYYIGEVSYRTEVYAEAEKAYKKGLDINPQCAECKIGLGKLALDNGKTAEAEEFFLSATRLDKKNPEVFALIGEAYLFGKKPNANKAIEFLEQAKGMSEKVARYWAYLGDAYKLAGNNGEAMTHYEIAVGKDPNNTSAYISMARIWSASRQNELAIEQLLKAIELSPNDALPYKDLIEQYIKTGAYDKVTPLLEKYVSLTGTDVEAKVRLVKFLTFQAKDYDRAIQFGEETLKAHPDQYTLHRWLAWAYYEKGKYQESHDHSVALFDDIKKKEGRQVFESDYEYWAKASLKLGLLDEAAHIYRKYLELVPSRSEEIYGLLAKAYLDAKNYEQAIAYYKRKAGVNPLSNTDNYYLAYSLYMADKNLESDSTWARVLEVTPDFATAHLYRAKIGTIMDTTEVKLFLAQPHYENYIKYAEADTANLAKYKKDLIVAYNYMTYYYVQQDKLDMAKEYVQKALALDAQNEIANEYWAVLKQQ